MFGSKTNSFKAEYNKFRKKYYDNFSLSDLRIQFSA